jgi:threonine dehydrogenase-like Zn-dependent dehydrogenase
LTTIPQTMRAITLSGAGFEHLALQEVPVPKPGPRQMLARVDAAGVCTSLIKIVEQGASHSQIYGWDIAKFPLILGDEGAVTILEVGAELAGQFSPGQRCAVQPAVDHEPVNWRERYRDGAKGVAKVAVGYTLPGHLAEYILLTEEAIGAGCVVPLPDQAMPAAHAAAAEPISCCVSAQEHHLHITQAGPTEQRGAHNGLKPGGVTVIIGAGAMGRMHVDVAISYKPRVIICADFIPERLQLIEKLFAARAQGAGVALICVNPREKNLAELVAELTGHLGADDVIVAVGSKPAIESAQTLCGRGAVLNLFGGLKKGEDIVDLDAGIVHYKEINVTGSSGGSPWDLQRTLALMAGNEIETAAHITRIAGLEHVPEIIAQIKRQELDGKAIIYPHRPTDAIRAVESWTADDEQQYLAG